jgi:ParB family chromosome partitioning protein
VIAEFADEPDLLDRLMYAAIHQPARFEHVAAQLRADRAHEDIKTDLLEHLAINGVPVIDEPEWGGRYTLVEIDQLYRDAELTIPLSPTRDATVAPDHELLGLCAYVTADRDRDGETSLTWVAVYCIQDWADHGFFAGPEYYASTEQPAPDDKKSPTPTKDADRTPEQIAATEERRKVIANNKAWPIAREVRIKWITEELLARKTMPATAQTFIAQKQAGLLPRDGYGGGLGTALEWLGVTRGGWALDSVVEYLGKPSTNAETFNVAISCATAEEQLTSKDSWRFYEPKKLALYLTTLQSWGYGLSDLEQDVIDQAASK